jgi:esterase/lipase superfamily enzyme
MESKLDHSIVRHGARTAWIREYHKGYSTRLGREMELLVFGACGPARAWFFPPPAAASSTLRIGAWLPPSRIRSTPASCSSSASTQLTRRAGTKRTAAPRWRITRQIQYEDYLIHEVLPLIRQKNSDPRLVSLGCSFGGYHAVNIALRHPEMFSGFVSLSGVFDMVSFLGGYYDQDCYYNLPTHYLPRSDRPMVSRPLPPQQLCAGHWLATTSAWRRARNLDRIMNEKEIPHGSLRLGRPEFP